jgi:acyl-CoA hydrolase
MPKRISMRGVIDSLEFGESVYLAGSCGEPSELTQLLVEQPERAQGVRFVTSFVPGINQRNLAVAGRTRRMRVFLMQPEFRAAHAAGLIEFCPMNYFGIQQYLAGGDAGIDTAIVQVSEPDGRGLCSLGPAVEFMPGVLKHARRVFGIMNSLVPRIPHSPTIPMDGFACVARSTAALAQYDVGASSPVVDQIAERLAAMIPSGATLQIGLGKIPNQVARRLHAHRDLAFHGGMMSDAVLQLRDAGTLRADKPFVTGVVVGREALYESLPSVAGLHMEPVACTHDPAVLHRVPQLYAINSALEVDLTGQVNAEVLNGTYVSGPGGLPDFAAAAHRQPDGLSIIALPSTDQSRRHPRIVPRLAPGTPVTVAQHDVDAVVTEFGVALLRGQDLDVRVRRLIEVAHPDHRDELRSDAKRLLAGDDGRQQTDATPQVAPRRR